MSGPIWRIEGRCRQATVVALRLLDVFWVGGRNRFDGGCAPPKPAPLAAAGVRGEHGICEPSSLPKEVRLVGGGILSHYPNQRLFTTKRWPPAPYRDRLRDDFQTPP